jgi:hypothetical protein
MNMSVAVPPSGRNSLNTNTLPDGSAGVAPTGPAAAGNLGFDNRKAFDRAWDDNWVPPVMPKPRPPLHALELAGNTELVRQVNELLYADKPNPADIQSLMDLMSTKIMELAINGEALSVQDRKTRIEANQKAREKELMVAREKAVDAEKNKEWTKFWNMLKAVGTWIVAAAVTVASFMTGNPLGVAFGMYMLANATMDVVDAVRAYQGKDPIGWRLSVGELAGWIAKKLGADEQTQAIVNAVTEIVFGIAMAFATGGASLATSGSNVASNIARLGMAINAVASIAKGIQTIKTAILKYEQAESKARLDRLKVLLDRLQADMERSNDLLKVLQEAISAIWDAAADRLKMSNEAQQRIWGGGRRNMI